MTTDTKVTITNKIEYGETADYALKCNINSSIFFKIPQHIANELIKSDVLLKSNDVEIGVIHNLVKSIYNKLHENNDELLEKLKCSNQYCIKCTYTENSKYYYHCCEGLICISLYDYKNDVMIIPDLITFQIPDDSTINIKYLYKFIFVVFHELCL